MRRQGFVHPATLVPDELEYAEGYKARMNVLRSRMIPIGGEGGEGGRRASYEDPD